MKKTRKQRSFLLIDDDKMFASIISATGKKQGMKIETLNEPPTTEEMKGLGEYEAVLLDYDLDTTTGFAVAEQLRKTFPKLPILLVSSTNRPCQDKLASRSNIAGFVSKWLKPIDFLAEAKKVIASRPGVEIAKLADEPNQGQHSHQRATVNPDRTGACQSLKVGLYW